MLDVFYSYLSEFQIKEIFLALPEQRIGKTYTFVRFLKIWLVNTDTPL
jgi:hypothetical protein